MRDIPWQMKNPNFKFLRIAPKSKKPIDEWKSGAEQNHLEFNDPKLIDHINAGGNIGILGGYGGLVIIDCDKKELEDLVRSAIKLPTLVEKTSKGKHFFFICQDFVEDVLSLDLETDHYGEIRSGNIEKRSQTVIAPSIHESGMQYEIIEDNPIALASREELLEIAKYFIEDLTENWKKHTGVGSEFSILHTCKKLGIDISNFKKRKHGEELQGPHPFHGSTGGINFCINTDKNIWHCFRDNTGGTSLHLVALKEQLLKCGEPLGELYHEARKIAKEKYGIVQEPPFDAETAFRFYEEFGVPEPVSWLVPEYIPAKGVTILAGMPGCGKSFVSEEMISAIVSNRKFCNSLEIMHDRPVILIDLENDHSTLYERLEKLGGIPNKKLLIFNFEYNFDLTDVGSISLLMEKIEELDPSLVVFDTLRRTYSGDENDSKIMNSLYKTALGPISKKRCVLLIAHNRKPSNQGQSDELSEIRGTGDITGLASSVLLVRKNADSTITIKPLKLRPAKLAQPITIKINDTNDKFVFETLAGIKEEVSIVEITENRLISWLKENVLPNSLITTKEIIDGLKKQGIHSKNIQFAMRNLKHTGMLAQESKGKYIFNPFHTNLAQFIENADTAEKNDEEEYSA